MSFQKIDEALDKAFELIETDHLDEARAILKPILDTEKDNPDVWWLYAHSVTDPETARLALNNVQRLDPNYLNTGELLYALENRPAGISTSELSDKEPSFLPPAPSTLPDLPQTGKKLDEEDEWDAFEGDGEDNAVPWFRRPAFLLLAGLLLFLIVAALFILNPQQQTPTATETIIPTDSSSVIQIPTLENVAPTVLMPTTDSSSVVVIPTLENAEPTAAATTTDSSSSIQIPTLENVEPSSTDSNLEPTTPSSAAGFDNIVTAMSAFELPDQPVAIENTSLGNTLVISVCTEPGAKLRQDLPMVMDAFATQFNDFPVELDGAGIRMLDCASGTTLLMIGVPAEDIRVYTSGELDKETFQAKWQPLS